ncbi:arginase family protein [Cryptosporangium aurantiacum]|uniref:Arginase n=1 Tax=Cryptosporangium aurantiacum TaxID=134849 RepID=A0A1M7RKM2_9ACTN|nr:arginase family protein [Cryptosporangium aurantiacum]SHN46696.1 arginase [Cryptosporangium aurantiacum]
MDLITVPFNSSGSSVGVARAPSALLDAGLATALPGARVVEAAVPITDPARGPSGLAAEDALAAMVTSVSERVLDAWAADRVPVVLGGDCPVLLGGLVAAEHRGYGAGLVFVDGHEDAWDPHRSPSGEAADSEIALALGWVPAPAALAPVLPCLRASDLVQLGPRDATELADAGQRTIADRVPVLAGERLAAPGGGEIGERMAAGLIARTEHWWLHVDLDVLSTGALSAVDYPQPGGLTWDQLETLTASLLRIGGCGGLSVCIYNPDLDGGAAAGRIAQYVAGAARLLEQRAA